MPTLSKPESGRICKSCPFRRDSARYTKISGKDHFVWYTEHFRYPFELPDCTEEENHVCLGSIIHVLNLSATSQLPAATCEIAVQYEKDFRLIFTSNGEFVRYHYGEDFGSAEWFARTCNYMQEPEPEEEPEVWVQGELF